jgi:hypothetical protein
LFDETTLGSKSTWRSFKFSRGGDSRAIGSCSKVWWKFQWGHGTLNWPKILIKNKFHTKITKRNNKKLCITILHLKKHLAMFYSNMIWWCFITSPSKFDCSLSTYGVEAINISSFSFLHIFILLIELHITNEKTFKIDRMKGVSKFFPHNEKNSWIYIVTMCLNLEHFMRTWRCNNSQIHDSSKTLNIQWLFESTCFDS